MLWQAQLTDSEFLVNLANETLRQQHNAFCKAYMILIFCKAYVISFMLQLMFQWNVHRHFVVLNHVYCHWLHSLWCSSGLIYDHIAHHPMVLHVYVQTICSVNTHVEERIHLPMKPFITAITTDHKAAIIRIAAHWTVVFLTVTLQDTHKSAWLLGKIGRLVQLNTSTKKVWSSQTFIETMVWAVEKFESAQIFKRIYRDWTVSQ